MSAAPKVWWKRRRFLLAAGVFVLFVTALAVAVIRSDASQIIIYNDTGSDIGPLSVSACGQREVFRQIADETSIRIRLRKDGGAGALELSLPDDPAWHWEGNYLESHGGYLVFVHLRKGMDIEAHTQISIWQQLLFGRSAAE